jgi:hypothetical protein
MAWSAFNSASVMFVGFSVSSFDGSFPASLVALSGRSLAAAAAAAFFLRKAFLAFFEGRWLRVEPFVVACLVVIGSAVTTGDGLLPAPPEAAAAFFLRNAFLAFFEGRGCGTELFAVISVAVVGGFSETTGDDAPSALLEAAAVAAFLLRIAFLACLEGRVLLAALFAVAFFVAVGFTATPPDDSLPESVEAELAALFRTATGFILVAIAVVLVFCSLCYVDSAGGLVDC